MKFYEKAEKIDKKLGAIYNGKGLIYDKLK